MEQMACTQFVRRIGQQMDLIRELRIKLMEKEKGSGLLLKELEEAMPNPLSLKLLACGLMESETGPVNGATYNYAARRIKEMADRIEKVMKGLQPIRASNESLISRETNDKIGSEFLANLSANPK